MIVDVHTHFSPESYIQLADRDPEAARATSSRNALGQLFIKPTRGCPLPLGYGPFEPAMYDVRAKLASMDSLGVDVGAVSAPSNMFFYSYEAADALHLARMWNDGVAQVCRAHPTRFVGLATVPMQSPAPSPRSPDQAAGVQGGRDRHLGRRP